MLFDFYKDYQELSDEEIIQVLKRPFDYQLAAVDAAQRILDERGLSLREPETFEPPVLVLQSAAGDPGASSDESILEGLLAPKKYKASDIEWPLLLFAGILLWYLYLIGSQAFYLYRHLTSYSAFSRYPYINLVYMAARLAALGLLYSRSPWGWRLVLADLTQMALNILLLAWYYLTAADTALQLIRNLWPLAIVSVLIAGSWQQTISDRFGVAPRRRWVPALAGAAFFIFVNLVYYIAGISGS